MRSYSGRSYSGLWLSAALLALGATATTAETITVGIGHQSTVTNTVPGGVILEKLGLLQKHLPKEGKYKGVTYEVVYQDYTSGPPITNQMLAGKLQFGVMGDYPLITNGAKHQETGKVESRFIQITGYNLKGTGNGIVVPVASNVHTLEQLAGKALSTPVGSAAWGMTLKVLRDRGLIDKIEIKNQAPPVGVGNIAQNKIDAHANFCPWSEVMEFRGTGRKILDGSEVGIPTFHGTVVSKAFADAHPDIVQAYVNATLEAQDWINKDPLEAAIKVAEWTGIEKEVLYLYFSKGGISTFEASIKPQWVESLKYAHGLLTKEVQLPPLDFDKWIDPTFVKKAYEARGKAYDGLVASVVAIKPDNPDNPPAKIWIDGVGVKVLDSVKSLTSEVKAAKAAGKKVNATYVFDKASGLKLFGHVAFYVETADGKLVPFMKKADAEAFAATAKGKLAMWPELTS